MEWRGGATSPSTPPAALPHRPAPRRRGGDQPDLECFPGDGGRLTGLDEGHPRLDIAFRAGEVLFVQPSVAIEVRSPGDETYEKLAFYAAVGVEALMVVERDTRAVQVFVLSGGDLVVVPPLSDGWTPVAAIGIEARTTVLDHAPALHLRLSGEPATERAI